MEKKILFEITSEDVNGYESNIYFVNHSDETLEYVGAGAGGFATVDDDEVISVEPQGKYQYRNVKPEDKVLVDRYDIVFDSDFLLQLVVTVVSKKLGKIEFTTPGKKGQIYTGTLLYDDGTSPKDVWLRNPLDAIQDSETKAK